MVFWRRAAPHLLVTLLATGCAKPPASRPCFTVHNDSELRSKDASKSLEELSRRIQLAPEDEALRNPKSLDDVTKILRRDVVYLFGEAAAFARTVDTLEGRFSEATIELLLGDSQLVASQILTTQAAWVGGQLRTARANLASQQGAATSDRERMLGQLIRVVEEGNKVADALGVVAPAHLARGAELIRQLEKEAPNDFRTSALVAEYHRLRGEWAEFDEAMRAANATRPNASALCYLRAMEQVERHRRPDAGAAILRECLVKTPKFLRAQAALVLISTTQADAIRELARLKAIDQDHYLVMLLEPTLVADQELGRMQDREAQRAHASP